MWFQDLMGFKEASPEQVRNNLSIAGTTLTSLVNGKVYEMGTLETPTLHELRDRAPSLADDQGPINITEIVGNIRHIHSDSNNAGAFFQAASQFNLLEMVGPNVPPEYGVGIYENDHTQGPACAIACGAGTIYRNYFAPVNGQIGQTADNQINCLDQIGKALNNPELLLWKMSNGYALANKEGLQNISKQLEQKTPEEYDQLKGQLKIGLQWNTEVTTSNSKHLVSQAYCSALPVRYSQINSELWKDFAKLILEATYEATFYSALINAKNTGNNNVYLTLVGGGVFGNEDSWIFEAIRHSLVKFQRTPLAVKIVSYGRSNPAVRQFLKSLM